MMLLDKERLEFLEEAFSEHPKGIILLDFVKLMKESIPYREADKYDFIYGLCRLFEEIDINGD